MTETVLDERRGSLPAGWLWKPFGQLVTHSQNGISKRRSSIGTPTRVLRLADVRDGEVDESSPREIKLSDEEIGKYALHAGDLLCVRVNGSRSLTGRLVYFRSRKEWAYCDHFIRFRLNLGIASAKYLAYYFDTEAVRRYLGNHMVSTAGQNTVSQGTMFGVAVPLAPPSQQRAIVVEIEKQFSRLDEAIALLKRTKANLKRYKAAVLKAAVEGKFTEDWRKAHPDVEPASKLLERILAGRRAKRGAKGKCKEPADPDGADLSPMPAEWIWTSLDSIVEDALIGLDRGRAQQSDSPVGGVPYIKMNNVTMDGRVVYENLAFVPASGEERTRFALCDGDLLFNTRNSKELVGKVGLVRNPPKGSVYNNNLMRIRIPVGIEAAFVCSQMCSHAFRAKMELVKRATTNVAAVYAKDLFPLAVTLPSTAEQKQIMAEVERRLSFIDELESTVDANLTRADRMRQSILARAFTGELTRVQ